MRLTSKKTFVVLSFCLTLALCLTLYVSRNSLSEEHGGPGTRAAAITPPTDGQGIYESCVIGASSCVSHLSTIAAVGFKLVINYDSLSGNATQVLAYADKAASAGIKLIWGMSGSRFWDGTDLRATYPALAATCNCTRNNGFISYVINLVKNHPATYGYYIGDEVDPSNHNKLKEFADFVHQVDPTHPRLFMGSATGSSNTWMGTSPFYDTADIIGDDYYPVGYAGQSISKTAAVAQGAQAYANAHGLGSVMTLQAFNQAEYSYRTCNPWPGCATFPTKNQMEQMLSLALQNLHPRIIFWYSYYDILGSSNPDQHWSDLVQTVASVNPAPSMTPSVPAAVVLIAIVPASQPPKRIGRNVYDHH